MKKAIDLLNKTVSMGFSREKGIYVSTAAFFYSCRDGPFFVPVEQLARHEYINSRKWNDERTDPPPKSVKLFIAHKRLLCQEKYFLLLA